MKDETYSNKSKTSKTSLGMQRINCSTAELLLGQQRQTNISILKPSLAKIIKRKQNNLVSNTQKRLNKELEKLEDVFLRTLKQVQDNDQEFLLTKFDH